MASYGGYTNPYARGLMSNPRYARGNAMLQAGINTSPVGHWTQGLARLLQAGVGSWEMGRAEKEEEGKKKERAQKLGQALQMMNSGQIGEATAMLADHDEGTAMNLAMYGQQRKDRQADTAEDRAWRREMDERNFAQQRQLAAESRAGQAGPAPVAVFDSQTGKVGFVDAMELRRNPGRYAPPEQGKPSQPFAGNSMDAQAYNILLQGNPSSPEYAAAYSHVAQPKAQLDPGTGQVVTIRPDMSPFRPPARGGESFPVSGGMPAGVPSPGAAQQLPGQPTIARVGDPNPKAMPPEQAAKLQMVQQGISNVQQVEQMLFGSDGSQYNRGLVASANIPLVGGSIPGTEGAGVRALILNAVEARLRAESGAAVPEEEVKRAAERFVPTAYDSPEVARQKIQLLREGLQGGMSLMDPQGLRPPANYAASPLPSAAPPVPPPPPQAPQMQAPQSGVKPSPQPGAVEMGYRFKGGNPADPNSWELVR